MLVIRQFLRERKTMTYKLLTYPKRAALIALLCALCLVAAAQTAYASPLTTGDLDPAKETQGATTTNNGDIMLGMFFQSDNDTSNTIYATYDGSEMTQIAQTYQGGKKGKPYSTYSGDHFAQYDPSIIYHNGYFWCLSGWGDWEPKKGKIHLLISYSKDLVHWTHPEGMFAGNGIPVDTLPTVDRSKIGDKSFNVNKFDYVAPEWSIAADGNIYITVSCGYYGAWHGQPTKDQMQVYVSKVTKLSCSGMGGSAGGSYYWPSGLTFKAEKAKRLSLKNSKRNDWIDGSMYAEGGTTYLVVKRDGLINQLYKTTTPNNPKSWKLVKDQISHGFEGPSIAKLNGKYYLFTDHVNGADADGVRVATSKAIGSGWSKPAYYPFTNGNGFKKARHGTAIVLKKNTAGWKVAKALLDKKVNTRAEKPIYWLVNKKTGENLYTPAKKEVYTLWSGGKWTNKGVIWYAPTSGESIYRLYNPKTGDHHYTKSANEVRVLTKVKKTWKADFNGKAVFYSGGSKGVWRQYSESLWKAGKPGTHKFTTVNVKLSGWKNEGALLNAVRYGSVNGK